MVELLLMRHAKSDWSQKLADADRPLNARGRDDALHMGAYLAHKGLCPDRMIVSTAERTRETAGLLLQNLHRPDTDIIFEPSLYLASYRTICDIASEYAVDGQRLLLLAHNPGMDDAVFYLAGERPPLTASGKLMTTASVAHFRIEKADDFRRAGRAQLVDLLRPKEVL